MKPKPGERLKLTDLDKYADIDDGHVRRGNETDYGEQKQQAVCKREVCRKKYVELRGIE